MVLVYASSVALSLGCPLQVVVLVHPSERVCRQGQVEMEAVFSKGIDRGCVCVSPRQCVLCRGVLGCC